MRENLYRGTEHQPHTDILSIPSPRGRVNKLWVLALGFAMFAGLGCEPHLGEAKFCHNLAVDGQPAVLQLVQMIPGGGEREFMAGTGECSRCGRIKINDTFEFELRDQSGQVLLKRYLFLPVGFRTYLMKATHDPGGNPRLDARPYPLLVACKNIPTVAADGGASSLILEDDEGDEGSVSFVPDDSSETPLD
jgi:hypothetical protein